MRIEVTKDVASHHTNLDYTVLRVRWNGDSNFQIDAVGPNWVPKDLEVMQLVSSLALFSPTFYRELRKFMRVMNQVRRKK